jgi:hypothetical protein
VFNKAAQIDTIRRTNSGRAFVVPFSAASLGCGVMRYLRDDKRSGLNCEVFLCEPGSGQSFVERINGRQLAA